MHCLRRTTPVHSPPVTRPYFDPRCTDHPPTHTHTHTHTRQPLPIPAHHTQSQRVANQSRHAALLERQQHQASADAHAAAPAPSIPAAHPHCDPFSPSRPGPAARRHRRLSFSPRLMATRSRMWRWVRGALAWVLRNGPRARARARAHRLATESARLPARGRTTTRHHCYPHPREVCSRPAAWCATASSAAHHYLNASSFRGAG